MRASRVGAFSPLEPCAKTRGSAELLEVHVGLHSTARSAPESQLSEDSFLVVANSMGFLIKAAARRLYRLESCGDAGPKSLLQGGGRPRMLRPAMPPPRVPTFGSFGSARRSWSDLAFEPRLLRDSPREAMRPLRTSEAQRAKRQPRIRPGQGATPQLCLSPKAEQQQQHQTQMLNTTYRETAERAASAAEVSTATMWQSCGAFCTPAGVEAWNVPFRTVAWKQQLKKRRFKYSYT